MRSARDSTLLRRWRDRDAILEMRARVCRVDLLIACFTLRMWGLCWRAGARLYRDERRGLSRGGRAVLL